MSTSQRGFTPLAVVLVGLVIGAIIILLILITSSQKSSPQSQEASQKVSLPNEKATSSAGTNPFDTYKNPFKESSYTNPFSQFSR